MSRRDPVFLQSPGLSERTRDVERLGPDHVQFGGPLNKFEGGVQQLASFLNSDMILVHYLYPLKWRFCQQRKEVIDTRL